MLKKAAILALATLAGACASSGQPRHKFARPGTTYQTFMQDRFACIQQATGSGFSGSRYTGTVSGGTYTNGRQYLSCMLAKGYTIDADGYAPPGDAIVPMSD